ncbi:MAG: S9 family peptidase, partial [Sphingomonadaceae bacterium]
MFRIALLAGASLCVASPLFAQDMITVTEYPETRREALVESKFGEDIADPYRWLENDVRNDAEVADWVARENAVTDAYLEGLPATDWFKKTIS